MSRMIVDDVPVELGDAPLTILCHKGNVHIEPIDQVEIGPQQTVERASRVTEEEWASLRDDPAFAQLFNIVFPTMSPLPRNLRHEGLGVRHVVGMLLMLVETITATPPRRPFLRYPESYLHPSAQSKMAELLAFFTGSGKSHAV